MKKNDILLTSVLLLEQVRYIVNKVVEKLENNIDELN